jgi:hypothetical protein
MFSAWKLMFLTNGPATTLIMTVMIGSVEYAGNVQAEKEVQVARVKVFGGSTPLLDASKG